MADLRAELKRMPGNLLERVEALERKNATLERALVQGAINLSNGKIVDSVPDLYTVPWTDYSADSTITGWSSFTEQTIYYKQVGKLVFVQFRLFGTSNNTASTFTLPLSQKNGVDLSMLLRARDNGTWQTAGALYMAAGGVTVQMYINASHGAWTATGTKSVAGQFWYEAM